MNNNWTYFAHDHGPECPRRFQHFGSKHYVELFGSKTPIAEVTATEDPEGDYWGWLAKDAEKPSMIWGSQGAFSMCFPYGPEVEEEKGKGRIVRLTVKHK